MSVKTRRKNERVAVADALVEWADELSDGGVYSDDVELEHVSMLYQAAGLLRPSTHSAGGGKV
jgi:hypothetical protein